MKLLRYGAAGKEKPGMLDKDGRIRDLSAVVADITGEAIGPKGLARLKKIKPESLPLVRGKPRIGACIANPQKFIAIGLNYSDHAAESGLQVPKEPVVFTKQVSCLSGPYDDVTLPPKSKKSDWEVELGIIIGSRSQEHQEEGRARRMSRAIAPSTTSPSANSRRSAPASGPRASPTTPSAPWAPGW